jgi:hypothetical protein
MTTVTCFSDQSDTQISSRFPGGRAIPARRT